MTQISVIVPMRNASAWIDDCLDALQSQCVSEGGFEIIVVDNGSTDDSVERVRKRHGMMLLEEPLHGSYAARNRGLEAARGDLVAFIDADCVAQAGWLESLRQAVTAPGEERVVMGRDIPTGPSSAIRLLGLYDHHKEIFALSSADPSVYYGHTNCMIVDRHVFGELGPFDDRPRGADVIFVQRVVQRFGTSAVCYQPTATVNHLEVRSAPVYFRKAFIYGRSARAYRRVVNARPLRNRERFQVFRTVLREESLTTSQAAYLLLLLAAGVVSWYLGSLPFWRAPAAASARGQETREGEA